MKNSKRPKLIPWGVVRMERAVRGRSGDFCGIRFGSAFGGDADGG